MEILFKLDVEGCICISEVLLCFCFLIMNTTMVIDGGQPLQDMNLQTFCNQTRVNNH